MKKIADRETPVAVYIHTGIFSKYIKNKIEQIE